jgi:hypothetical protein
MRNSNRSGVLVAEKNKSQQRVVLSAQTLDSNQMAFSLKDASIATGVTLWALRSAVWEGKLPARLIGKRQIVLKADLERWLVSAPVVHGRKVRDRSQSGHGF